LGWISRLRYHQQLKKTAEDDFRSARGYAHLDLLTRASDLLDQEIKRLADQKESKIQSIRKLKLEEQAALDRSVTDYIVHNHLNIPGIGAIKRSQLLSIYKGRISDFSRAQYLLNGFGPATQQSINRWIEESGQLKKTFMKTGFPGENEICRQFSSKIDVIKINQTSIENQLARLTEWKAIAVNVIQQLRNVSKNDFLAALVNPDQPHEIVDNFNKGLFAECEPVPDWLKNILAQVKL